MKKMFLLFTVSAVLFVVNPVYAQFGIGLAGGLNFSTVYIAEKAPGVHLSNYILFSVGTAIIIPIFDNISLQLEPEYIQKGSKVNIEEYGNVKVKAHYIESPVMFRYDFGRKSVRPYVIAGMTTGFLLSAKQKAAFISPADENIKDTSYNIDWGLTFGGGIYNTTKKNFDWFIQARYAFGLSDTDKDEDTIKSRGLLIKLGIIWKLNIKT